MHKFLHISTFSWKYYEVMIFSSLLDGTMPPLAGKERIVAVTRSISFLYIYIYVSIIFKQSLLYYGSAIQSIICAGKSAIFFKIKN